MTLLKISTGECNLKELHEFKNNTVIMTVSKHLLPL